MQKSEVISKHEAIEIMIRPMPKITGYLDRVIEVFDKYSDEKFMKEFEIATDLKLKKFYDSKYQIVWETT